MSRSVNRITLIGNAGGDPRVSETEKGTAVAHLSLATDRVYRVDEEEQQRTEWHRLTFWGGAAETVGRYVRKGSRLYVDGRMEYGSYERDGVTIPTADVVVRNFVLLGARSDGVPALQEAEEEADPAEATTS